MPSRYLSRLRMNVCTTVLSSDFRTCEALFFFIFLCFLARFDSSYSTVNWIPYDSFSSVFLYMDPADLHVATKLEIKWEQTSVFQHPCFKKCFTYVLFIWSNPCQIQKLVTEKWLKIQEPRASTTSTAVIWISIFKLRCNVQVQISLSLSDVFIVCDSGSLEGKLERPSYEDLLEDPLLKHSGVYQDTCPDLSINCQIWADNLPISIPITTSYKSFSTRWK